MAKRIRMNEAGSWVDKHGPSRTLVIAREGEEVTVSDKFAEMMCATESTMYQGKKLAEVVRSEANVQTPVNEPGPVAKAERKASRAERKARGARQGKTVNLDVKPDE